MSYVPRTPLLTAHPEYRERVYQLYREQIARQKHRSPLRFLSTEERKIAQGVMRELYYSSDATLLQLQRQFKALESGYITDSDSEDDSE